MQSKFGHFLSFKAVSSWAFILITDDYISWVLKKLKRETNTIKTKTKKKNLLQIVHAALKSCKTFPTSFPEVSMFCRKTVLYAVNGQVYLTSVISTKVNVPLHIIAKIFKLSTLWKNFGGCTKKSIKNSRGLLNFPDYKPNRLYRFQKKNGKASAPKHIKRGPFDLM